MQARSTRFGKAGAAPSQRRAARKPRLQAETTPLDNGDHIREPERMRREKDKAVGRWRARGRRARAAVAFLPRATMGPKVKKLRVVGSGSALEDEPSSAQHGAEVLVGRMSEQDRPTGAGQGVGGLGRPNLTCAGREKRLLG